MTVLRWVAFAVVCEIALGVLVGRMLRHRGDWAWQQEWDSNDVWDVPDDAVTRAARVEWDNNEGGQ